MQTRDAIATDDPLLAHTETVTYTADLHPGDVAVAIDRSQSYPPGFLVPLFEMTKAGLINRQTKEPAESTWADGLTILRVKV